MTAASYDIAVHQGNTLRRIFRFKDAQNQPFDLSGSEMVFRVLDTASGVLRRSTADGSLSMPDPVLGEVRLTLTPAETRTLRPGRVCRYELELRSGSGEHTLLAGFVTVTEGVNDDA